MGGAEPRSSFRTGRVNKLPAEGFVGNRLSYGGAVKTDAEAGVRVANRICVFLKNGGEGPPMMCIDAARAGRASFRLLSPACRHWRIAASWQLSGVQL
jgi:hypothetical protein